jgi:hypothetical protein
MSDVFLDVTALDTFVCHLELLVVPRNVQTVLFARSPTNSRAARPSHSSLNLPTTFGVGLRVQNARVDGVRTRVEV